MEITVKRITPIELWRECAEMTTGHDCKMPWSKILAMGHSPIRASQWAIKLIDVPLFVVSHLVRHHVGVQVYQKSHRPDRDKNAKDEGRMTPTSAMILCNAEALINMAHKRLCAKASPETREIFGQICELVEEQDPDLYKHLVPQCVYRGGICPESKCCGYIASEKGQSRLKFYKALFNQKNNSK